MEELSPSTAEEIVARYQAGERNFARTELPEDSCLRGANLAGANFKNSWLSCVDFREADLRGTLFEECNVKVSDFRRADLRGASFRGSTLCGVLLKDARLDAVLIDGATYYGGAVDDIQFLKDTDLQ